MADIELVIKIPEEKYEWLKENNPKADKNSIVGVIVYGTPLPKGHGDLIDASKLNVALLMGELYGNKTAIQVIDEAKPIIEADRKEQK